MDALQRATREHPAPGPAEDRRRRHVRALGERLAADPGPGPLFGIEGARLHAIGLAAFLHDIGKLRIPLEVLNKPGKLEGDEWRVMMSHAQEGATHLCGVEGTHPRALDCDE